MKQFSYTIQDKDGIHARPAGALVKKAKEFASTIIVSKDGKSAEMTKLMALMSLGIKCGDTVTVSIEGPDEDKAAGEVEALFSETI